VAKDCFPNGNFELARLSWQIVQFSASSDLRFRVFTECILLVAAMFASRVSSASDDILNSLIDCSYCKTLLVDSVSECVKAAAQRYTLALLPKVCVPNIFGFVFV
jgi:hypothetical protein